MLANGTMYRSGATPRTVWARRMFAAVAASNSAVIAASNCKLQIADDYSKEAATCATGCLSFDSALGPEGTPAQGSLRTNGSMVCDDHMCAVFPRGARKNRTPTEMKYRFAASV